MSAQTTYLIPKRIRPIWTPALEPLDLETEVAVELPLLGYVSAGRPVETPEDDQTVKVPSHLARKASTSFLLILPKHDHRSIS